MKIVAVLPVLMVFTNAHAEEIKRACGPGVYCVDQMLCLGHVIGTPPNGIGLKYQAESVTFRSAKFIFEGGSASDFTMTSKQEVGDKPGLTIEQAKSLVDWSGGDQAPPLHLDGKTVKTWSTGTSDGMVLAITSSEMQGNHRLDHLTGM